jgi:hypothetical protein
MGQYQQWLFAQEVDRHLRAERETLETELLYLQDRIAIMEQAVPEVENRILQALEQCFQAQAGEERGQEEMRPAGRNLPDWQTPPVQAGAHSLSVPALPAARESDGDMRAFFDKRRQTDPTLAAWPVREGARAVDGEHVVDEETRRLNEDIRRWFIRWRRQLAATERSEEVQNE